ncbi:MbnP family protein [Lacinutrix undariae]
MKNFKKYILLPVVALAIVSCSSDDIPVANNVTLKFNNTFGDNTIVLGDATSAVATENTSTAGQTHHFEELKYVISNIRLIKENGDEIVYNVNDLDNGATVVNQAEISTLQYVLNDIPTADYTQIKFGLGIKTDLNTLDQESFPNFYAAAGENDTEMHWEWGTGYRFTKIEGFYGAANDVLSIHTGSTDDGDQGVDAYREVTLDLTTSAKVGNSAPVITIKADFDALLSGTSDITLGDGNATPSVHTSINMIIFVENLKEMFSIENVEN